MRLTTAFSKNRYHKRLVPKDSSHIKLFYFYSCDMIYEPEKYWNDVAARIAERSSGRTVAGDDEPFYHYKRKKLLALLKKVDFSNKIVLEIGPGPGGNLKEVLSLQPKEVHGADISKEMLAIARDELKGHNVTLQKINNAGLPYPDKFFDVVYTVTVLQHNTNRKMLERTINEMCRITRKDVYIFERIEKTIRGTELCLGRPVTYYEQLFIQQGLELRKTSFLNIPVSYLVCGVIRKLFNKKNRKEGEPESAISIKLQKSVLPLTSILDPVFKTNRELAMLHFQRRD